MNAPAPAPENNAKRLARLAAVQGLYQIALTQNPVARVIADFHDHPPAFENVASGAPETLIGMDQELFAEIVTGVNENGVMLDEMIAGAFDTKLSPGRVEAILRAILRAGIFELHRHAKIPPGIIINDYVDVAHAFFDGKEPGLVNAVLDRLAKTLRG